MVHFNLTPGCTNTSIPHFFPLKRKAASRYVSFTGKALKMYFISVIKLCNLLPRVRNWKFCDKIFSGKAAQFRINGALFFLLSNGLLKCFKML